MARPPRIKGNKVINRGTKQVKGKLSDGYKQYKAWIAAGRPGGVFRPK